jgi:hypothetical protein
MTRRLGDRDLWAGVVFVATGVAALALGRDLDLGTAAEMGEGYVPSAMAILLVALGLLIVLLAWRRSRGGGETTIGHMRLRPVTFVTLAILSFAAALEPLGLIAAITASTIAANFAGEPLRPLPLLLLIGVLSLGVIAVFVWGLGLPVRALPRFLM